MKTWKMHAKEFQAVQGLPAAQRYSHFVRRVADFGVVWTLLGVHGWVLAADDAGGECVPVWPHARHADACVSGAWAGTRPEAIALPECLERWTPGMLRDGRVVAVFPTAAAQGVVVMPDRLRRDLERELASFLDLEAEVGEDARP
jgi:hypothetical protein